MRYRLPETEDKEILKDYVWEHLEHGENDIGASLGLTAMDYEKWLEMVHRNADKGDEIWGRSLLYLCFDEEKLIGLLTIRYELPDSLTDRYGNIGYGVRPSERNKGYASEMLGYALSVCKEKGMDKVIVGCVIDNLTSAEVIRKNGGIFISENENKKMGKTCRYYRIDLG
ncbi:MAG: GNAT family N-acetyltransferase [Erysipelotrichaceae bacterium]|nr:GNAT family N-acetyltransferase [Erysipelotrichaceae bacterium]